MCRCNTPAIQLCVGENRPDLHCIAAVEPRVGAEMGWNEQEKGPLAPATLRRCQPQARRRRSWAAAAGPAKSNLTRMQRNHHAPRPLGSLSLPPRAGVGDLRWQRRVPGMTQQGRGCSRG
jgi:hypothetical protein